MTTPPLSEYLLRGSGIATFGRILGRGIGYIAQIIFARLLAPESFGLFAIGWTILRLFSIAGHLGLDSGVIKFGGKYWQKDPLKLRSLALIALSGAFLSGAAFGLVLYLSAPWLALEFFRKPDLIAIFRGFALAFPFATTLRVAAATSSLSGKMMYGAVFEDIAQPILQIILFLALFKTGTNLNAALLSTVLSYGVSVFIGLFFVAKALPNVFSLEKISLDELTAMLKFSLPAIVGITLGAFNLWGDRLLVGYFSTEANTGIYQSISIITMLTTVVLSGFKITIAPAVSQMHQHGDFESVKTLTRSMIRWSLYISMPILIIVFVNANRLITGLFGQEYLAGTIPLLILTIGQIFYVTFGITDQIFLMTGKQKEWLFISGFIFILTIALDAIAIPRASLIGASVVSSITMLLLGSIAALRLRQHLDFWIFDSYHSRIFIASLITILITFPMANSLSLDLAPSLFITIPVICAVFVVFLLLLGIETSDRTLFYRRIGKK